MTLNALFRESGDGRFRVVGYARTEYSSDDTEEKVIETSEDELSEVFEKAGAEDFEGTGEPIAAAIEDPLRFRDFLILRDGEIAFDEEYVREID